MPREDEMKDNSFEKGAADSFRLDAQFMAGHISIAPPDSKLELAVKDTRSRGLPGSMRPAALEILEKPLRCLERIGASKMAPPRAIDELCTNPGAGALAIGLPPQPIPAATQKQETEFVETIEKSLQDSEEDGGLWDQYSKRAEELLITMPLDKILRVLKVFVLAQYRGTGLFIHIGNELAKEVRNASSTRLCQIIHWVGRAGLRDPTLMSLMGNETLLRLSDDFIIDMHVEVLNVHAKLEIRAPRLIGAALRDIVSILPEFSQDQCAAVSPLTVMSVFSGEARVAYLSRCAELNMGLPVEMTRPAVLRQFRLLEDCLRLDYHPAALPEHVQQWLATLKQEADALDVVEATPLSAIEDDILRVLREELDVAVTPIAVDGLFTVHLCIGKDIIEVLDSHSDYYITPALKGQRLLRSETKLRHRLLWRRGWRLLTLDDEEWLKLTDDLYKKDLLEDLLVNGPRRSARLN
jgi:hypothetical protein